MKKIRFLSTIFLAVTFSLLMLNSCEIFNPTYEEYELYGTWNIEDFSIDVDITGDNFVQVMAARALVAAFKGKLEEEIDHQIDSLGSSLTFNDDNTYILSLMEDADTGTWYYNEEANSISLTAEGATIDELNIERLTDEKLIISWISEQEELESDSTDSFFVQVTIEAVFLKEE